MSTPARILVLDGDQAAALSAARSLSRHGYRVFTASITKGAITSYSRASLLHLQYPSPMSNRQAFVDWLERTQREHRFDLIVPITERTLVPLAGELPDLGDACIAAAPPHALAKVLDKEQTFAVARDADIKVPRGQTISDPAQLHKIASTFPFPVVLKPARSLVADKQQQATLSVTYARNEAELLDKGGKLLASGPVILQELFTGEGVGIELIASHGEIVYAFQHRRLHEVPLTGGGSSLRISEQTEPLLLSAASALIEALEWHGVAMVEFKWHAPTQDYRLMEVNGRFWGSLPLAEVSGAHFPVMLAELLLEGSVRSAKPYKAGMLCRNLPRDAMWTELVLRDAPNPLGSNPPAKLAFSDALRVFSPRHRFDTQRLGDPLPGLVEIGRLAGAYADRAAEFVGEYAFSLAQRLLWRNGTVRERLRQAGQVLFVCYGNINRSALAELLAAPLLESTAAGLTVDSAGLLPLENRPLDPRMRDTAARHGQDLPEHRSKCVSKQILAACDLIFVMEKRHFDTLKQQFPERSRDMFLLGAADPAKDAAAIEDPYNQAAETYDRVYQKISRCIEAIVEATGHPSSRHKPPSKHIPTQREAA